MMGGYGSTRWNYHLKKVQVEECFKVSIYSFKSYLKPGYEGDVTWSTGGQKTGNIGYKIWWSDGPKHIQFLYTFTQRTGEKKELDYMVSLTTTPLSWGGVRYWFVCPLRDCSRRVGCLYLPPGGIYFGCRHCYDLTYQSCQEQHAYERVYKVLAASMQDMYPSVSWRDIKFFLEHREKYRGLGRDWTIIDSKAEKYANYLTAEELLLQSGLSQEALAELEDARLLLPDRPEGLYRPKLVGWGRKLAFLLKEGWETHEIKAWARGRWQIEDPRKWPPNRDNWKFPR